MNIITLVCLIIVLPSMAKSMKTFTKERQLIENAAEKGEFLNGVIQPLKNGFIRAGDREFTWRAKYENTVIGVQFVPKTSDDYDNGLRECENYEALYTLRNPMVIPFGLPAIFLCEEVIVQDVEFTMIGMSLFDSLEEKVGLKKEWTSGQALSKDEAVDVFLIVEYAIIQLKFAHYRRVRNYDLKPSSFLFHGYNLILTNWGFGERSDRVEPDAPFTGKTDEFTSRRGIQKVQRTWTDDAENLFNVFLRFAKVKANLATERNDKQKMLQRCNQIGHKLLGDFCKEFYILTYEPEGDYPNYNAIYDRAAHYKKQTTGSNEPVFFHWLNADQKNEAKKFEWPKIESIPRPPYNGSPLYSTITLSSIEEYPHHFQKRDRKLIEKMAKEGKLINNKIKLVGTREIGVGSTAIVWKAIYNNQEIALKFVAAKNENNVKTEVENHQVMKAHKNATAEDYGIPDMKYFGRVFNGRVYAIGLTLIESNSERLHMEEWEHGQKINDDEAINILLMMKHAIIPLRRAHKVTLKHNDLKPDCFGFHKGMLIIMDWNFGELGNRSFKGLTEMWASRRGISEEQRRYSCDIEALYNCFMEFAKILPIWIHLPSIPSVEGEEREQIIRENVALRNDFAAMNKNCEEIGHKVLVDYCKEFHAMAYNCPEIPDYKKLYELPDKYIQAITGSSGPVYFQWLKGKELDDAKAFKWPTLESIESDKTLLPPEPPAADKEVPPTRPSHSAAASSSHNAPPSPVGTEHASNCPPTDIVSIAPSGRVSGHLSHPLREIGGVTADGHVLGQSIERVASNSGRNVRGSTTAANKKNKNRKGDPRRKRLRDFFCCTVM